MIRRSIDKSFLKIPTFWRDILCNEKTSYRYRLFILWITYIKYSYFSSMSETMN